MVSNKVQEHGLRSSAWSLLVLVCHCHSYLSVYVHCTKSGLMILAVYVDILLTGSDTTGLGESHFVTKDMRKPRYFLGIEVSYKKWSTSIPKEVCTGSTEETDLLVLQ